MGQTIVLVSSKGGSGKSTVAVGLSAALSLASKKVLLIDIDEGARCLDTMLDLGVGTVFDIADVVSGNATIGEAAVSVPKLHNLSVVPSPYENKPLDFAAVSRVVDEESKNYDYIILDTKGQLPAERLCDLPKNAVFVAVVTPEPVALKNTGILCNGLIERGIVPRLIINRFKPLGINKYVNNIDKIINTCSAQLLGIVPEDKNLSAYVGKPIIFGSAAKAIHRIAARLSGEKVSLPKIKDI